MFKRLVQDPKTTLTGALTAVAILAKNFFGIDIPSEAILTVAVFVLGFFSRDSHD